jgi:hypothetical protein
VSRVRGLSTLSSLAQFTQSRPFQKLLFRRATYKHTILVEFVLHLVRPFSVSWLLSHSSLPSRLLRPASGPRCRRPIVVSVCPQQAAVSMPADDKDL